jgi:hypothetical protein
MWEIEKIVMWHEWVTAIGLNRMPFVVGFGSWFLVTLLFSFFYPSQRREFYGWFGVLVVSLGLGLIVKNPLLLLGSLVFSGVVSWILAIRFYYFFPVGWLVLTGYLFYRYQGLLIAYVPPRFSLILGSVLWFYGSIKSISGRTIQQVAQGWGLGQIGFFILVIVREENFNLFYEIAVLGLLGGALASILGEKAQRFHSIFLSEWEGRRNIKMEVVFVVSSIGLAIEFICGGIVFWQSLGAITGLNFLLGWLLLVLSYWRVGQHLFVKRSLRLEPA